MSSSSSLQERRQQGLPTPHLADGPAGVSALSETDLPAVGIVIPNYNTKKFIGATIASALSQDHPNVRVVVVDDGSTDDSRALLESYGDRITLIFQPNAGQLAACQRGAADLTTPIVIFVDADDVLTSNCASTVASAWRPGVSKIQYQLDVIDADGDPLGIVFPKYPPALPSDVVRQELLRTGAYFCPPGLGNAYARDVLLMLPQTRVKLPYTDAVFATFAPLVGEVITLPVTLGQYRVHGNNVWSMREFDADKIARRRQVERDRTAFLDEICQQRGIPFDVDRALRQQVSYQEHSLALARSSAHDVQSYLRNVKVLGNLLQAILSSGSSPSNKLLLSAWACLAGILPWPLAREVLMQRMAPTRRWGWIERLVGRRA
jgi:glycosyltransferase involved in cell wall biosynthesis